ncbi:MAG: hypothetical protein D6732_15630 [Methanobacteriota archaeon]|nr:MAG: hypothetical protein D6732_15630 [Euryarchaeota archaeon]
MVRITEPVTTITDYMITIEAIFLMILLGDLDLGGSAMWIKGYFILLGLGALLGGTAHGFKEYATQKMELLVWRGSLVVLGATSFCLVVGLSYVFVENIAPWVQLVFGIAFIPYLWRVKVNGEFIDAIMYYGVATLVSITITVFAIISGNSGASLILTGFLVLILGTFIQMKKIGIHKHFNHNDIFHVFTMVAIWFIYKGLRSAF